jgi:crossover junction endodeoxyribonuclease RuvC
MVILGIDPGASGALVFLDSETQRLTVYDMPVVEVKRGTGIKRHVSAQLLAAVFADIQPDAAFLEQVGAMPGQGVSSMFAFGRAAGVVEGVIAAIGIPLNFVTPQTWQKAMAVRGGKDGSRMRAAELFPKQADQFKRVKDDGRADATLIAAYGAKTLK